MVKNAMYLRIVHHLIVGESSLQSVDIYTCKIGVQILIHGSSLGGFTIPSNRFMSCISPRWTGLLHMRILREPNAAG
jgi:hypothetical protein